MKGKGVAAAQKQKSIFKKLIFFQFDFRKIFLKSHRCFLSFDPKTT